MLREKSNCVACWSSKSRAANNIGQQGSKKLTLLKQVKNKK